MKILCLVLLAIFWIFAVATAADALDFAWDQHNGDIKGFLMYCREAGSTENVKPFLKIDPDKTAISVDDALFEPGVAYDFWLTAYNDTGESGNSNTVNWSRYIFVPEIVPRQPVFTAPQEAYNFSIDGI